MQVCAVQMFLYLLVSNTHVACMHEFEHVWAHHITCARKCVCMACAHVERECVMSVVSVCDMCPCGVSV